MVVIIKLTLLMLRISERTLTSTLRRLLEIKKHVNQISSRIIWLMSGIHYLLAQKLGKIDAIKKVVTYTREAGYMATR